MDVNAGSGQAGNMHDIGPLTYRQGHVMVWAENHGCREDALMHDRVIVGVYTGPPEQRGDQMFRAWVDAEELPSVLERWANVLR
ncbi:hypothetical protein [Streptomyces halstedii]|uniref:hypothetical protein n=1 Tax=Streptomyces halstedii TaxID=1944 RepID=UPI003460A749